jgi:hypothetical protein
MSFAVRQRKGCYRFPYPWRTLPMLLLLSSGCTWLCHYTASGEVVVPFSASTRRKPPLDDVVAAAIKPLGFSDGHKVHIPGYPLGHYKSEPDHDYVDFEIGVPYKSFFPPENQVLVRTEPATGKLYISDLRNNATQAESAFVKTVRQTIERQVQSVYGVATDIRKEKVTSAQCFLASWP